MELELIKQNLKYGDIPFIARSTDKSIETVKKVLEGKRNNTLVLKAAELVATNNESLAEQIRIMAGE